MKQRIGYSGAQIALHWTIAVLILFNYIYSDGMGRALHARLDGTPATDLGINSMTVSKAYQLLKAEGFLETDRRRGSVVSLPDANRPGAAAAFEEKLTDELELLTAEAKVHGMTLQDFLSFCTNAFLEMEVVS